MFCLLVQKKIKIDGYGRKPTNKIRISIGGGIVLVTCLFFKYIFFRDAAPLPPPGTITPEHQHLIAAPLQTIRASQTSVGTLCLQFLTNAQDLDSSLLLTINTLDLAKIFKSEGDRSMCSMSYAQAIEFYFCAIGLCGCDSAYYYYKAIAFCYLHKYAEAIKDSEKAIALHPNFTKVYNRLGLVYCAQGKYCDAIDKGFAKGLQLNPNNNVLKNNIEVAERIMGMNTSEQDQAFSLLRMESQ